MNLTRLLAVAFGATVIVAAGFQRAAGAPAAMHVKVTGRDYASQLSLKPMPVPKGAIRYDHETWGGKQVASDPRVSGRYRSTFDTWEYADGRAHFADMTFSLKNARGSWRGGSIGVKSADGSHFMRAVANGAGSYRGLRYVAVFHDKASGTAGTHLFEIDGWIERASTKAATPVSTGDIHVKITGRSMPVEVLPAMGLRAGAEQTSDPRTTGTYRGSMQLWTYPDGRMHFSGSYELANKLGAWKGVWHGVVTRDRRYVQFVDALGRGEFAGLRYRHVDSGTYPKSGPKTIALSVNGWIESVPTR